MPWLDVIAASTTDIRRLSTVWRFSSIPVAIYENTAEHSFYVAIYAAMIHLEVSNNKRVLGAVIMNALMHDVAEAVTGDVVRPFKYSSKELREEINRAEHKLTQKMPLEIRRLFTLAYDMSMTEIDNEDVNEYVEAVVKAADFLSLFQYMRREAAKGNLEIIPFYNRMVKDISAMMNLGDVTMGTKEAGCFKPKDFYFALWKMAEKVRKDSFHGLEKDPDWHREI